MNFPDHPWKVHTNYQKSLDRYLVWEDVPKVRRKLLNIFWGGGRVYF